MKSKVSNTNKLTWDSQTFLLSPTKRPSQSLIKLVEAGYTKIQDLLWIIPLRSQSAPTLSNFDLLEENTLFLGEAEVINIKLNPAFGRRGKNKVQLFNATVIVKDTQGNRYLNLKWYNAYPSLKKQLETLERFTFMGTPVNFKGTMQISNPTLNPKEMDPKDQLIEYPTINSVPGSYTKKIIEKIPLYLWTEKLEDEINKLLFDLKGESAISLFGSIHGQASPLSFNEAIDKLKYFEFFSNQLKVLARKLKAKKLIAKAIEIKNNDLSELQNVFPYSLTPDQSKVVNEIRDDLRSGTPMMRMIQGDVGSGKTSVAIIAALIVIRSGAQVAIMCPTEALARQHAQTISNILDNKVLISLLLGASKNKKHIYENLSNGQTQLIIGTHSLIQSAVIFSNLKLAIIDEQHKFGVEQRQKLFDKGSSVHGLIMTATPIPRTLQLTQYGDLEISTIRTMPKGRKGTQTRIVSEQTYEKYLGFIKTRAELKEQVYIVVPAIEESETLDLKNITSLLLTYTDIFPNLRIKSLHGQLSSEVKQLIMDEFTNGEIDILISTSVIEVGIDVINSTVMSIYNPDRFGLSSLHQLRGRVGRGGKPGFCFLITDQKTPKDAMDRLKIIEKTTDGFEIAEADLKNRGQGDLFGKNQSGHGSHFKLAHIVHDFKIFEQAISDINKLKSTQTERLNQVLLGLIQDKTVVSTI